MEGIVCLLFQALKKYHPPPPSNNKPKALSLGVSPYSPWDLQMANDGYEVLEFDASIKKSPYPRHKNIKFFKQFVGAKDEFSNGKQVIALSKIIKDFDFAKNAHNVLQCDIENAEWDILEELDIGLLKEHFSQLIFEFHGCEPDDEAGSSRRLGLLRKINEHFVPIWVHYNNYAGLIVSKVAPFCPSVELTYLRKDLLPSDASAFLGGVFDTGIDSPNSVKDPDIPVIFPQI